MTQSPGSVEPGPRSDWRIRSWFRRNWLLDTAWRITVFVIGLTLVCLGIVLLILPGPGWALIAVGLVVLASEYVWAQRLLQPVRQQMQRAAVKARDPRYRNHVRVLSGVCIAVVLLAVGGYVWRYGLTLDGVRGLWPW